ncbi:MAG: integration host factor subunit alpha [Rhodoferax sp.]|nr:integration host factor subunit alpha [Rhodoferax sp.]
MDTDALDAETDTALTKAQLSAIVYREMSDLSKSDAKEMIDVFFELIASSLIAGRDVKLSSFGSFQIRSKAPRPGRNPRTGAAIPIGARRVVTFHASHKLKDQMQAKHE